MNNDKKSTKNEILSFFCEKNTQYYAINEPISKIISNFKVIEKLLKTEDQFNLLILFCLNINIIHNILYKYEQIIYIKYDENASNSILIFIWIY